MTCFRSFVNINTLYIGSIYLHTHRPSLGILFKCFMLEQGGSKSVDLKAGRLSQSSDLQTRLLPDQLNYRCLMCFTIPSVYTYRSLLEVFLYKCHVSRTCLYVSEVKPEVYSGITSRKLQVNIAGYLILSA